MRPRGEIIKDLLQWYGPREVLWAEILLDIRDQLAAGAGRRGRGRRRRERAEAPNTAER